jgi:hypothetical protein
MSELASAKAELTENPAELRWSIVGCLNGMAGVKSRFLIAPFRNGIKFPTIMGHYKGRVQLRLRKKRFAKDQRIKALADSKKGTTLSPSKVP